MRCVQSIRRVTCLTFGLLLTFSLPQATAQTVQQNQSSAPLPMVGQNSPVDWWFVFKFNAHAFPGCGDADAEKAKCCFGGDFQKYDQPGERKRYSQQYVFASSKHPTLQKGTGCIGRTEHDPVGATFARVYNGSYFYVVWNDQFYGDPNLQGNSPWGHSKGMVAWNAAGEGFVMQVSTPSWPASGSAKHPRKTDGNTLGCISDDDVEVSQHFFCLRLTKDDLVQVLNAVGNASVVTDPKNPQVVNNGGPADVQKLVGKLGHQSDSQQHSVVALSSGVKLISKPSQLHVPPWQLVSASLQSVPLRVASWWAHPQIPSTDGTELPGCWDKKLGTPGPVQIALTGQWKGTTFGLRGGLGYNYNHAKIGVTTDSTSYYSIFGDMNQQGAIRPGYAYDTQKCSSSQNGRGGTFYVLENEPLWKSITELIQGKSAPTELPLVREYKETQE